MKYLCRFVLCITKNVAYNETLLNIHTSWYTMAVIGTINNQTWYDSTSHWNQIELKTYYSFRLTTSARLYRYMYIVNCLYISSSALGKFDWGVWYVIIFGCDQAALWMVQSVRPSVRLSVRPSVRPSHLFDYVPINVSSWRVITNDKSDVHAKSQGQRSKVKVTEVTTQLNRFRTVTPVWIHIWWWNDAYSLMMLRRGALLFLKVIRQISRSHGSKKRRIWPRLGVSGL